MILDDIVAAKRAAQAARPPRALDELWHAIAPLPPARPFTLVPTATHPAIIAEHKRKSPSAGAIRPGADPGAIAAAYARAGAAAVSVLTDEQFFDGANAHIAAVHAACPLPILRKDFLLDARDVLESRLLGADAVLLIVRLLDHPTLATLISVAARAGLATLVEAHDDVEIAAALTAGAHIIGVNHRDLDTLAIDLSLSKRARQIAGPEAILVAESGLSGAADLREMRARGLDAALIGEALMRAPSPGDALAELLT